MTKTTQKATNASAGKATTEKSSSSPALMVLGFDAANKPRGARFEGAEIKLVAAAAKAMSLNVYKAESEDLAAVAQKLPIGRLYSNGKGFVPNVRQSLYSQCIGALAVEPQAAIGHQDAMPLPVAASGLPKTWDEIAPGHLVIAQEALANGWWEAIVLDRHGEMLTLRFRDYPTLPKFVRHRAAVALITTALCEPPTPSAA
jgi:hypothetical protein